MKPHPIASLFPPMPDEDYKALVADMKEHGQRETAWTYQGQIIDGVHRLRACNELGIPLRTSEWNGNGSLTAFVLSLNLRRRHLTQSQKATVAADALPLFEAEAKEKYKATVGRPTDDEKSVAILPPIKAREQVATTVGVSPRYVQHAKKLKQEAPEVFAAVRRGEVTLSKAIHDQPNPNKPHSVPKPKPEIGTVEQVLVRMCDCIEATYEQRSKFLNVSTAVIKLLKTGQQQLSKLVTTCEARKKCAS